MSGFKSGETACLRVAVSAKSASVIERHCPGCKRPQPFRSTAKFRVNAQKKRIDAWLIFRCIVCDERWKWPIHERRSVGALDRTELDALMRNDPGLAARHADAALKSSAGRQETDPSIQVAVLHPATAETRTVEIEIAIQSIGIPLRLDRLLARALSLGRAEIDALGAAITVTPANGKALRRPAGDGQRVRIDLALCAEEVAGRLRRILAVQAPALY